MAPARLYVSSAAFLHDTTPRNLGVIEGERKRRSHGYDERQSMIEMISGFAASLVFIAAAMLLLGNW